MFKYYLDHPEEAKRKLQVLCLLHHWVKHSPDTFRPEFENLGLTEVLKILGEKRDALNQLRMINQETRLDELGSHIGWPDYKPPEINVAKMCELPDSNKEPKQ